MLRQRLKALRDRIEKISKGEFSDGNEAIKAVAGTLLELMATPHEDAVESEQLRKEAEGRDGQGNAAEFRKRVEEIANGAGKGETTDARNAEEVRRHLAEEKAAHVPMAHGAQGEEVRRQMLDARAHAGDGDGAAAEVGAKA